MGVADAGMKLKQKIAVENGYSGNGWNFEKTTKYIFEVNDILLEAGYFEHYMDDEFVKAVIELPVSHGCRAHCRFCAASGIERFRKLESEQMKELLDYIWQEQKLDSQNYILLSVTGTGDLYYNFPNTIEFLEKLAGYKNLHVTLSSCFWTRETLRRIEQLSEKISFRNVQITYISDEQTVLGEVIPAYQHRAPNWGDVLEYLRDSKKKYYRINYILIKDINDSVEKFGSFSKNVENIKDKIVIRISRLNETKATKRNQLCSGELEKMEHFKEYLKDIGIKSYLFYALKNDYMNCGQLITENKE